MKGRRSKKERGVALLIALFALMLLAAVAFEMMYVADTETLVNRNFRDSQRSYDAAWSGVQEARERLMPTNTAPHLIVGPKILPGGAGSILYLRNPRSGETIDPTAAANRYFDNEICHENFAGLGPLANPGIGIPCTAGPPSSAVTYIASDAPFTNGAGALDYKWVRITQKANNTVQPVAGSTFGLVSGDLATPNNIPICWNGTNQTPKPAGYVTCDDNPPPGGGANLKTVYVVTTLAITPTGARRMAQMEVALDPPIITNAAVDSQDHVNLSGQLTVNGFDSCNCTLISTCTKLGKNPGTGTFPCNPCSTCYTGATCDKSKYAIYASQPVDPPGASETVISGLDNPATPANEGIAQNAPWIYDIPALIDKYKSSGVNVTGAPYNYNCSTPDPNVDNPAQTKCDTQTSAVFGTPPPLPPPAAAEGSTAGAQITYVPGNIKLTSTAQGNGILVIDGDLEINGGLNFYGLILVRGTISFTGGAGTKPNIYGAVLAGQQSFVNTTLGGTAEIDFDSCALNRNLNQQPPNAIAFRELQY